MRVTVLGSGTSTGVPLPGCNCRVCTSEAHFNRRLRTSIHIQSELASVLIDSSPDLRFQALRAGIKKVDAVFYTHTHADHIFGLDDLRAFNFSSRKTIPLYALEDHAKELTRIFGYAFNYDPKYEGGSPPQLELHHLTPGSAVAVEDLKLLPLVVRHGSMNVCAFRIGTFAYVTDCSDIPDESASVLGELDVLILDGLRKRPHKTHLNLEQAVREVERLKPKQTYLTHISHELEHHETNRELKKMTDFSVELAYDGLELNL